MFIVERTLPCSEPGCSERRMVGSNGGVFPRCEAHQRAFWAMAAALRKNTRALPRKEVIKKEGDILTMHNQAKKAREEKRMFENLLKIDQRGDRGMHQKSLIALREAGYITSDDGVTEIIAAGRVFMRYYAERNQLNLPEGVIEVEPGRVERENGTVYREVVTPPPSPLPVNGEGEQIPVGKALTVDMRDGGDPLRVYYEVPAAREDVPTDANGHECGACDQCDYRAVVEMIAQTRPEVRELVETMGRARRLRQALKI